MRNLKNFMILAALFSGFAFLAGCASAPPPKQEAPVAKEEPKKEAPQPVAKPKEAKKAEKIEEPSQPKPDEVSRTEQVTPESEPPFSIDSLKGAHFDFDKFNIRPGEDRKNLAHAAEILKKYKDVSVVIEGHCDERGTAEYNMALGDKRAHSVIKYLVSLGVDENRLSAISYGEEKPLDPGHSEEAWAKNRRAVFTQK
jgi:peptidoglycan-associated lipoprotein